MQYYINPEPDAAGRYGNPVSRQFPGMAALPEALLDQYLDAMGFIQALTLEGDTVTGLVIDREAYEAYQAAHPEPDPAAPVPTALERMEAQVMYTALMTDTLLEEG